SALRQKRDKGKEGGLLQPSFHTHLTVKQLPLADHHFVGCRLSFIHDLNKVHTAFPVASIQFYGICKFHIVYNNCSCKVYYLHSRSRLAIQTDGKHTVRWVRVDRQTIQHVFSNRKCIHYIKLFCYICTSTVIAQRSSNII